MAAGDINDPLSDIPGITLRDDTDNPTDQGAGFALLKFKSGALVWLPNGGSLRAALDTGTLAQIHGLTEKASPVGADELLIEDSAASWAKKRVPWSSLPGAGSPAPATHRVTVKNAADQTIANNTFVALNFGAEDEDTDGYHDNVTNNSRITIPSGQGGYYLVIASVLWKSSSNGRRILFIQPNGGIAYASHEHDITAQAPSNTTAWALALAEGEYVEAVVYQNSGGNVDVWGTSGNLCYFQAVRLA